MTHEAIVRSKRRRCRFKGRAKAMRMRGGLALAASLLLASSGGVVYAADEGRDDTSALKPVEILFRFYDETLGFRWTNRTNWANGDDVCEWYGIECYGDDDSPQFQGHVRSIDLSDNHLVGTIPHETFELPYLKTLILRDNPDLMVPLTNAESSEYLENLILSNTAVRDLTGIKNLRGSLQQLHLTNLQLTGKLHPEVLQLTSLRGLFANYNGLTGEIPPEIGDLTHLRNLYLFENDFSGQVPTEIGMLSKLQVLTLASNSFSGTMPEELNILTDLNILSIARKEGRGKGIGGKLPALDQLSNLNELYMDQQVMTGEIPQDFLASAPKDQVVTVDLTNNFLKGTVPAGLTEMSRLALYLADNLISDLPTEFCDAIRQTKWMGGDVESYGCDAFLCPAQTFAESGRKTGDDVECQACADNPTDVFGRTTCDASQGEDGGPPLLGQRDVLVKLYNSMGGQYWTDDRDWLSEDTGECGWHGIRCDGDEKVTTITLSNNGLTGTPPKELWASLTELTKMDLSSNALEFEFEGIGGATKLEFLDLTNTETSSFEAIEEIASTSIFDLRLSSNPFAQKIPQGLFEATTLTELYLSHTQLTGELPPEIGKLNKMQVFHSYGNEHTDQIPSEIGLLTDLRDLVLSENKFEGTIPDEMNQLKSLETISLHQTHFEGGIGGGLPSFKDLTLLTQLHLDGNRINGDLPDDFLINTAKSDERIEVFLSDNLITGGIPSGWANRFDKLVLDVTGNRMDDLGDFPCAQVEGWMDGVIASFQADECAAIVCPVGTYNEFGRRKDESTECRSCDEPGGAQYLGSKDCNDNGEVNEEVAIIREFYYSTGGSDWKNNSGWTTASNPCDDWYGVECNSAGQIVRLALSENGLKGTPSSKVFDLPALQELDLASNAELQFSFDNVGSATKLEVLYLSETAISSLEGVGDARSLVTLHLTGNDIEGPIPDELFQLTKLRQLYMNYNRFSGRVPADVARLTSLEELYLLHNRLEGQIPASIGALKSLRILSLSENDVTGTLPAEINDMTALEIFAVQRETSEDDYGDGDPADRPDGTSRGGVGLRGPLPPLNNLEKIQKLFLGNNGLTGTIPFDFLNGVSDKTVPIEVDLSRNSLSGPVPPSLVQFDQMSIWVAGNQITGIADGLCLKEGWMNGTVADFGCDAILCPNNTSNEFGRQKGGDSACNPCGADSTAKYFGSFQCETGDTQRANDEREILTAFYNALDGQNWGVNDGWLEQDNSICLWHGITCTSDQDHVADIHLVSNSLSGRVPKEVFDLVDLDVLNLAGNEIEFSFDGVGNSQLGYLNLGGTGLTNTSGIEGLAGSLKVLHIIDNNFGDKFPEGLEQLTDLEVLYLSDNAIGGILPDTMGDLSNLIYFQCSDCGLTGVAPSWFSSLNNLENLVLSQNAFTGPFPESLKSLVKLRHLDLSDQRRQGGGLTGELFDFSQFTLLTELMLGKNHFEGQIPDTFMEDASIEDVVTVDLRSNDLNGSVPVGLTRFPNLNIDLADNQISDVPADICNMSSWNDGQLLSGVLSGSCDFILCPVGYYSDAGRAKPDRPCEECAQQNTALYYGSTTCEENDEKTVLIEFFTSTNGGDWTDNEGWLLNSDMCTWYGVVCYDSGENEGKVQKLELADNNLKGEVPSIIWDLEYMTWLEVRKNNITIESFARIGDAAALQTLYLSETLVSSIEGLQAATSLETLHLTSTLLEGPIPSSFYEMDSLRSVYLNYNKLNGELSSNIGKLSNLKDLYLFRNELTGTIPSEIGKLQEIEVLALGENKFRGDLPVEMNSLTNLQILSLQQEAGSSPTGGGGVGESPGAGMTGKVLSFDKAPNLTELYLGANSFTGSIPSTLLSGVQNKSVEIEVDLTLNKLGGAIPASLASFKDMHLYVAGNQITGIPDEVRNMGSWMGGEVENGWDAILCPPGKFNEFGRRVNDDKVCEDCAFPESTKFYGSVSCGYDNVTLSERQVLRELYQATGGNSWKSRNNWLEDSVDICKWHGVLCVEGKVDKLELSDNLLQGEVPPLVFQLPSLRILDVSENPVDFKFLGIDVATKLEELHLDSTNVMSLDGIGKASTLQTLHIEQNNFGGELPEEIFELTELRALYLSDTGFSGTLSDKIGDLVKLKQFYCHGNSLSGEIPASLGQLSDLEHLVLSENLFFGTLPLALNNLDSLKLLDLDSFTRKDSGISGPLISFSNPKLRELYLGENSITGTIPSNFLSGIDDKGAVIDVGLRSNQITGKIPGSLSQLHKLNIDLADNKITDIDSELCGKRDWMNGYVDDYGCNAILCPDGTFNKDGRQSTSGLPCLKCDDPGASPFLGSITCAGVQKEREKEILKELYKMTGGDSWKQKSNWMDDDVDICKWYGISCRDGLFVESILLGSNNLVGATPSTLFELQNLEFLWLYSNPINFRFSGIGGATRLKSLLLDSTGLSSLEGIGDGVSLVDIDVRFNSIEGTLPSEMRYLRNLESFLCGNNRLTGAVPSFATNRRLQVLRMGDNSFNGTVPSFATQKGIQALDLSGNQLTGKIPQDLFQAADVSGSVFLDLSSNSLSGTVPGELSKFEGATLFLRDNMIEGIHSDLCTKDNFNGGDVGVYNCDGILCPIGTYGPDNGRASQNGDSCLPCDKSEFFGASECGKKENLSAATGRYGALSSFLVLFAVVLCIV